MVKRMLLVLSPSDAVAPAIDFSVDLARCHDAELAALSMIEMPRFVPHVAVGDAFYGDVYSAEEQREISVTTHDQVRAVMDTFNRAVTDTAIKHRATIEEGVAADHILEEARYYDLLVVGRKPHFAFSRLDDTADTLAHLVKNSIAPVIVTNGQTSPVTRVLIAFDGSPAASRTLQRYAQYKLFRQAVEVSLVHVRDGHGEKQAEESNILLRRAAGYLRAHGYPVIEEISVVSASTAQEILEQAERLQSNMIVAGAHSVSAIKRATLGSTTHALLERCDRLMFLYH